MYQYSKYIHAEHNGPTTKLLHVQARAIYEWRGPVWIYCMAA